MKKRAIDGPLEIVALALVGQRSRHVKDSDLGRVRLGHTKVVRPLRVFSLEPVRSNPHLFRSVDLCRIFRCHYGDGDLITGSSPS